MKKYLRLAATLFFVACLIQTASAASINYNAINIGGDRWQYDYTITNTTNENIYSFAIWFGSPYYDDTEISYTDLAVNGRALGDWNEWDDIFNGWIIGGWDTFDGQGYILSGQIFAESLDSTSTWLAPDESLGLSVSFNWLLDGTPGDQFYELFGNNYNLPLEEGYTSRNDDTTPPVVPEPQTFMLFGTGLICLAAYYRRNRKR